MSLFSDGFALGLLIIPILAFLIIIHELGHFFAARSVGVKVEEFGIGIPPRAKGWTRNGVIWSVNWIPFGGFVRVKGEDGADMGEGSMNRKGPAQRAFFLAAGSAMNFIAAFVISVLLVAFQGSPDNTDHIYVMSVMPGSPAEAAGWVPGDVIEDVNGETITGMTQLQSVIGDHLGESVDVTIRRGDETIETSLVPRENPPKDEGATGISMIAGKRSTLKLTAIEAGLPGAAAGWQSGDVVVAIDGIPIESEAQARGFLMDRAGTTFPVTIERGDQLIETQVNLPLPTVNITQVREDSPAGKALLYPGDQIVTVNGREVTEARAFVAVMREAAGTTVTLQVVREGRPLDIQLEIPVIEENDIVLDVVGINGHVESPYETLGVDGLIAREYDQVAASEAISEGWNQFWWVTTGTFEGLERMVTNPDREQFAGPIGMGQLTSESLQVSTVPAWVTIGTIMMAISLGLGVLNLMPLPALDGGRLLFVLIEVVRGGRRISPEKEGLVHLAGMVMLLGLMFLIAFGDVSRLLDGRSFFS